MQLQITNITATTAAGVGNEALLESLNSNKTGLVNGVFDQSATIDTFIGSVAALEGQQLPKAQERFTCRNNLLAYLGLCQDDFLNDALALVEKYGASRVGVFIGTSTSGIYHTEQAYRERNADGLLPEWYDYNHTHNNYSSAQFVADLVGAKGPSFTVSTACSSSAKVFVNAANAMAAGFCDAAIVGGVDSLCLTTLFGFNALQLVSDKICSPCDVNRKGISIGEAAGFAIVEKETAGKLQLLGYGESSDAYHMSTPHPEGLGASSSMEAALARAKLNPEDISYINMHGTGTLTNDLSEARAIRRVFGAQTPASSTKGWTGHTLGAAGIVEATISYLALRENSIPCSLNTTTVDPEIDIDVVLENSRSQAVEYVLSNSFGFGGSNCSLLFGKGSV